MSTVFNAYSDWEQFWNRCQLQGLTEKQAHQLWAELQKSLSHSVRINRREHTVVGRLSIHIQRLLLVLVIALFAGEGSLSQSKEYFGGLSDGLYLMTSMPILIILIGLAAWYTRAYSLLAIPWLVFYCGANLSGILFSLPTEPSKGQAAAAALGCYAFLCVLLGGIEDAIKLDAFRKNNPTMISTERYCKLRQGDALFFILGFMFAFLVTG